jgi:c(7)-type cytochrome triheme protein
MLTPRTAIPVVAVALASLLAVAGDLPRLPKPHTYPEGKDSPAPVTFRHETHVDKDNPDCTGCHPVEFSFEGFGTAPLVHKRMDKGEFCGRCHDKKTAFGMNSCDECHIYVEEEDE